MLIFEAKWSNYASASKPAPNSDSFWVRRPNATILLVDIPAKIKMSFIWKDDFFCQNRTKPYSFGGRIKLIIYQIRHELSVTIYEISSSWKKNVIWRTHIYIYIFIYSIVYTVCIDNQLLFGLLKKKKQKEWKLTLNKTIASLPGSGDKFIFIWVLQLIAVHLMNSKAKSRIFVYIICICAVYKYSYRMCLKINVSLKESKLWGHVKNIVSYSTDNMFIIVIVLFLRCIWWCSIDKTCMWMWNVPKLVCIQNFFDLPSNKIN